MKKTWVKNGFSAGLLCILAVTASFAIYNLIWVLLLHLGAGPRLAHTGGRLIASLCILAVYHYLFGTNSFGIKGGNFFHGMATGGFLFLVIILNFAMAIMECQEYTFAIPPISLIFAVVLEQLLIGVFEEFLFRGFVLNTFLAGMKHKGYRCKMAAVSFSSVLFGLIHLINLTETPELVYSTITQVIYAAFIGFYLGVLYLRTKNIWVVVVYHMLIDLIGSLTAIFYQMPDVAGSVADSTASDVLLESLLNSVFLFAALFLARKLKNSSENPAENNNNALHL